MTRPISRPGALAALLLAALIAAAALPATDAMANPADKSKAAAPEPRDAEPAGATLARLAVCEDVVDRTPVGEKKSYPNSVGRLWCFTEVRDAEAPTQIFHRWYVGDELVSEIPITVRGARWRCWSRKTIRAGWEGPCRVEILTEEGDVLGTAEFALE